MIKFSDIKIILDIIVYTHSLWCAFSYIYSILKQCFKIWIGNKKVYTINQHIHIIRFSITNNTDKRIKFLSCECSVENEILKFQIPHFNQIFQSWTIKEDTWEKFVDENLIKDIYPLREKILMPNEKLYFKFAFDCRKNHIDISKLKVTIKTTLGIQSISFSFFQRVNL